MNWVLGDANSSIDGTVARTGSNSLKLINDGAAKNHNAGQYSIPNIQPGMEYAFSVWVKGVNVTGNGDGGKPLVVLRWRNASNTQILKEMYLWAPYGTYDWRELKINLQAPANAAMVDVSFRSWYDCTGGTTYWDDVSLDLRDVSYRGALTGTYQAETSSLNSGGTIESTEANYTGSGYFHVNANSAFVEWDDVDGGAGGVRVLTFRYALEGNERNWYVAVNGVNKGIKKPLATGMGNSWATIDWEVTLNPGNNTVRVTVSEVTAGPMIDKLDLYEKADGNVDSAATPTITPNGGSYMDSVEITLASITAGSSIYYTTDGTAPTTGSNLYAGAFTLSSTATVKAIAVADGYNNSAVGTAQFTVTSSAQLPYGGTAWPVPGTIEAEDYDTGGEGIAYHDTTIGNSGGTYREDRVDIWQIPDPAGYFTGANATGEWLEYTVDVAETGQYYLDLKVATANNGKVMHVEMDGIDITGPIAVPNTGAFDVWQVQRVTAGMSQGQHVLRVVFDIGGLNFDNIEFSATGVPAAVSTPTITPDGGAHDGSVVAVLTTTTPGTTIYYTLNGTVPTTASNVYRAPLTVTTNTTIKAFAVAIGYSDSEVASSAFTVSSIGQQPFGGTPWAIPGTIEAEDYDLGGESIAYHDTSIGNAGGYYRTDRVDIWYSSSSPTGFYTGSNSSSEWLEYTVDVAETTQYQIALQVATPNNGRQMHIELDGVNVTGTISIPNTGTFETQQTVSASAAMNAGQHVLRVVFDIGGLNFDKLQITKSVATPSISPNGGTHQGLVTVTLATTTAGATIYYTTDGSTPTTGSTVYNAPFTLVADATVKAFAVANGFEDSAVASAAFVVTDTPAPVDGNPALVPVLDLLLE